WTRSGSTSPASATGARPAKRYSRWSPATNSSAIPQRRSAAASASPPWTRWMRPPSASGSASSGETAAAAPRAPPTTVWSSPCAPLVDAVRRALADLPAPAWPALPSPWDTALAPFLPELAEAPPLGELRRPQVHEAWTLLLRRGFGEPLLLAIDDLQWLDEAY